MQIIIFSDEAFSFFSHLRFQDASALVDEKLHLKLVSIDSNHIGLIAFLIPQINYSASKESGKSIKKMIQFLGYYLRTIFSIEQIAKILSDEAFRFHYSELSNKHAANLILFEKIFPPTCLFYFWGKFPPTLLLEPTRLFVFRENSYLHDY